jgi:hypothetical protein
MRNIHFAEAGTVTNNETPFASMDIFQIPQSNNAISPPGMESRSRPLSSPVDSVTKIANGFPDRWWENVLDRFAGICHFFIKSV